MEQDVEPDGPHMSERLESQQPLLESQPPVYVERAAWAALGEVAPLVPPEHVGRLTEPMLQVTPEGQQPMRQSGVNG